MTTQLVADSISELDPPNTVSLALIANRYATNPSVAEIRILDTNKQVLATSGMAKTRQGEVFIRDALKNEKKVGSIEVTLIKPSVGEILRTQWLTILVSLLIHALLWFAYRVIARPTRSEYLARMNTENRLKHELQQITQALELEKQNSAAIAQLQQQTKHPVESVTVKYNPATEHVAESSTKKICLNIQFYDPKQLLETVNQSVSVPYFKLCQLFLNKSIELCLQHYQMTDTHIQIEREFEATGASIKISTEHSQAIECTIMISAVFQLLADVLYKRYREDKRFALQTRSAISNAIEAMQLDASQAAERLAQYLHAKEAALHLENEQLRLLQDRFQLITMPNPSNIMTRHAFMLNGMNSECAELAQQLRTEILMGKKAKQAPPASDHSSSTSSLP